MRLERFLRDHRDVVKVFVAGAQGSSPREVGAAMFVSDTAICGTIGGGHLEYMAIDQARRLLVGGQDHTEMDVPLGPEIGQCCGGRVDLRLDRLDDAAKLAELAAAQAMRRAFPDVLIFGAGHVGRALVRALAPLPVRARLIDSRDSELSQADDGVETCLTPLPEAEIGKAGAGAGFVIATHDHALDFLLTAEALQRGDAAYVGMIGSATKRARFESWARVHAPGGDTGALICPMGRAGLGDKRPEVIAAFIATELLGAFAQHSIRSSMESDA